MILAGFCSHPTYSCIRGRYDKYASQDKLSNMLYYNKLYLYSKWIFYNAMLCRLRIEVGTDYHIKSVSRDVF